MPPIPRPSRRLYAWARTRSNTATSWTRNVFNSSGPRPGIPTLDHASDPESGDTLWEKRWLDERGLTPDLIKRAEDAVEEHRAWFRRALQAGVKWRWGLICVRYGMVLLEMGLWVKDGATPWQTLLAATRYAAEVCGVGHELGTIEVGKLADLIVVAAIRWRTSSTCAPWSWSSKAAGR